MKRRTLTMVIAVQVAIVAGEKTDIKDDVDDTVIM